jgi:hypothetical protein
MKDKKMDLLLTSPQCDFAMRDIEFRQFKSTLCSRDLQLLLGWDRAKAWAAIQTLNKYRILQHNTQSTLHFYKITDHENFKKFLEGKLS